MSYDIKTAVSELCIAKSKAEEAKEERQSLEKILLSNNTYTSMVEKEKEASEIYEWLRKRVEEKSYIHMKEMKSDKWTIYTDYWKITFKIELSPVIKDEDQVISYLNEQWLQEFLKQAVRAREFKAFALTQVWDNEIPWITIEESTKLIISTS